MKLEDVLATPGWSKSPDFVDLSNGSERPWYVYKHTSPSGKCYVGYSHNPDLRWRQHVAHSRRPTSQEYEYPFKRAIRLYSPDVFTHELLCSSTDEVMASKLELEFVDLFGSFHDGYNSTPGGECSSCRPKLSEEYICDRAMIFFLKNEKWPKSESGLDEGGYCGDTWRAYSNGLSLGLRGLPGGSSLAKLLSSRFGVRNCKSRPRLSKSGILELASYHRSIFNAWPNIASGEVKGGGQGDTWKIYDHCLREGQRGLPGGSSLAEILSEAYGAPLKINKKQTSEAEIVCLAKNHFTSNGYWPNKQSGPVHDGHPGDTWRNYDYSLREGLRGLPGGSSLAKLLDTIRKPKVKNET